jgi:OmpR family response regulator RpaB|tara:strand:+ start:6151 stop:6834 length:684 start_codon:yes stop_codon:yes gene_type:complete
MANILLIDDDERLGELLADYFSRYDLELQSCTHPDDGLRQLKTDSPDLVILDVMLPEKDGFEVCRSIRQSSTIPIIMLTARGEVTDRIVGLELGADDYIPKPFEPRELVARIQSVLKRASGTPPDASILRFKHLQINRDLQSVQLYGEPIELTTMEYQLLVLLASSAGKTFTRDEILNHLRGIETELYSRSVDILVSRLRQKLGDSARTTGFIRTVWGTGYFFIAER